MTSNTLPSLQCESDYLSGVALNFEAAKGKLLRGSIWQSSRHDELDRLKGLMASHRNYDRELLKSLPANRRIVLHGFESRWFFWRKATGVAVASVLTPLEHFASGANGPPPPVGLGELLDHVRRLVTNPAVPNVIGVCSPSGFTEEARKTAPDLPNVTLVLVEPDGRGGWSTHEVGNSVDPRVLRLFDPERLGQKLERVRRVIDERSAELLIGGLSVSAVAQELGVSEELVRQGFEQEARRNPELKLTNRQGEYLLFRGAAPREEIKVMGVIDRIRQLFSGEGQEAEKINLLAERRAALARRRDRIYEDISKLEKKEADLLAQGKAAKSEVPKRRLAAQLAQLRKDIARQNTTAAMLNQQINILSTDIHNLTLIQQGRMAELPDTAELTENAVRAEELLETLKADSELVGTLASGMETLSTSEEELAILREFEGEKVEEGAEATKVPEPRAPAREAERQGPARANRRPMADPLAESSIEDSPGPQKTGGSSKADMAEKREPEPT
jgi:hypothetical protein